MRFVYIDELLAGLMFPISRLRVSLTSLGELLDPLDQEVHHERSGQTLFIILVPEHHVEHDAIAGVGLMFDLVGDELFDGVIDLQFDVEFIRGCPN
jgi:hypothetical protein